MSETITMTVLLFGACREAAGTDEFRLELDGAGGALNVAAAFAEIKRRFPALERFERSALFAVNEEHARQQNLLRDGDTLAIFPPVSGG
jgi:molybdopterin synthase sulfur carrier subunit